jgi:hypothetical protein
VAGLEMTRPGSSTSKTLGDAMAGGVTRARGIGGPWPGMGANSPNQRLLLRHHTNVEDFA